MNSSFCFYFQVFFNDPYKLFRNCFPPKVSLHCNYLYERRIVLMAKSALQVNNKNVKKPKRRRKLWEYKPRNIIIRRDIYEYDDPSSLTPRQKVLWMRKKSRQLEKDQQNYIVPYSDQIYRNCADDAKYTISMYTEGNDLSSENVFSGEASCSSLNTNSLHSIPIVSFHFEDKKPEEANILSDNDQTSPLEYKQGAEELPFKKIVRSFARLDLNQLEVDHQPLISEFEIVRNSDTEFATTLSKVGDKPIINPTVIEYIDNTMDITMEKVASRNATISQMYERTLPLLQKGLIKHRCINKNIIQMEIEKLQNYRTISTKCIEYINAFAITISTKHCCK